jgi:hypothetical protein
MELGSDDGDNDYGGAVGKIAKVADILLSVFYIIDYHQRLNI